MHLHTATRCVIKIYKHRSWTAITVFQLWQYSVSWMYHFCRCTILMEIRLSLVFIVINAGCFYHVTMHHSFLWPAVQRYCYLGALRFQIRREREVYFNGCSDLRDQVSSAFCAGWKQWHCCRSARFMFFQRLSRAFCIQHIRVVLFLLRFYADRCVMEKEIADVFDVAQAHISSPATSIDENPCLLLMTEVLYLTLDSMSKRWCSSHLLVSHRDVLLKHYVLLPRSWRKKTNHEKMAYPFRRFETPPSRFQGASLWPCKQSLSMLLNYLTRINVVAIES